MDVGKQFSRDSRPSQSTTITGSKNQVQSSSSASMKSYQQNPQKSPQSKYYDVRKIENDRSNSKNGAEYVNSELPSKETTKTSRANEYIERLKEIREIIKNRELQNLLNGLNGVSNTKSPNRQKEDTKSSRVVNNENFDPWLDPKSQKVSKVLHKSEIEESPNFQKSRDKGFEENQNSSNNKSKTHSRLVSINEGNASEHKKRVDLKTLNFGYSPHQKKPEYDQYTPPSKKKDNTSMKISITKHSDLSDSYIRDSENSEEYQHTFRNQENRGLEFPPGAKTPSEDEYDEEPIRSKRKDVQQDFGKNIPEKGVMSFDKNGKMLSPFSPVGTLPRDEKFMEFFEKPKRLYTDSTNNVTELTDRSDKPQRDFTKNNKATPNKYDEKPIQQLLNKRQEQIDLKKSVVRNKSPREEVKPSPRKPQFFRGLEVGTMDDDPLEKLLGRSPSPIQKSTRSKASEPERKNQWIAKEREPISKNSSTNNLRQEEEIPVKKPTTPSRSEMEKLLIKQTLVQKSPINQKKASVSTIVSKVDPQETLPLPSTYRDFNSNGSNRQNLEIVIPETQRTNNQPLVQSPSQNYQSSNSGPHYPYYPQQMPMPQYPGPYMPPPNYPYYQMPYPPPNYYPPYNYMPPYQMPPNTGYMPYGYGYQPQPQPYYPQSMMENSYQQPSLNSKDMKYANSFAYPSDRNVLESHEDPFHSTSRRDQVDHSDRHQEDKIQYNQSKGNLQSKTPIRDISSKVTFSNDPDLKQDTKKATLTPKGTRDIDSKLMLLGSEDPSGALPETPRDVVTKSPRVQPQPSRTDETVNIQKSSNKGSMDMRPNKWETKDMPYSPDFKVTEFQPSDSRKVSIQGNQGHHHTSDFVNGEETAPKIISNRDSFNPSSTSAYHTFGRAKRGSLAKVEVTQKESQSPPTKKQAPETKEPWAMTYNFDDNSQQHKRDVSIENEDNEESLADRFMKKKRDLAQRIEHHREKSKVEEKEYHQRTKEEILRQRKEMMKPKHIKSRSEFNIQPGEYDMDESHSRSKSPFANSTIIGMFDDRRKKNEPKPELLERLTTGSKPNISKRDMLALTNKNYEKLPETQKRKEEEKKREEAQQRLKKAKEYNQKLRLRTSKYD